MIAQGTASQAENRVGKCVPVDFPSEKKGAYLFCDEIFHAISVDSIIKTGRFEEVKCIFSNNGLAMQAAIHKEKFYFSFALNDPDGFHLPYRESLSFIKNPCETTIDAQGAIQTFNNHPVWLNKTYYSAGISVSERFRKATVGGAFLDGFDWIIDYERHKLYCRKNATPIGSSNAFVSQYQAHISDNRIVIIAKKAKMQAFDIGDVIMSVNGETITGDNCLKWLQILNASEDWRRFDISILAKDGSP
jgi:hypothetical protein